MIKLIGVRDIIYYHLCAIQIQHVQTFLFDAIQSHEQEKQKDSETLKKVWNTSLSISQGFIKEVEKVFKDDTVAITMPNMATCSLIPAGSGMALFILRSNHPDSLESALLDKMKDFYISQYHSHQALMKIAYASTPLTEGQEYSQAKEGIQLREPAIATIKTIKRRLQSVDNTNQIIERFKNQLFDFSRKSELNHTSTTQEEEEKANRSPEETLQAICHPNQDGQIYKCFVPYGKQTLRPQNDLSDDNRFYLAFLKADLDGMGAAFSNVSTLREYVAMSDILSKHVSFEGIGKTISDLEWYDLRCCPIFAAGDDIFCAFRVNDIAKGVTIYKTLLENINQALLEAKVTAKLKMRIGIDITWCDQPIRYYYQRANDQMERCKETPVPKELKDSDCMRICINDNTFFVFDIPEYREYHLRKEELRTTYLETLNKKYASTLQKIQCGGFDSDDKINYQIYIKEKEKSLKSKEYKNKLERLKSEKPSTKVYSTYAEAIRAHETLTRSLDLWDDFLADVSILNYMQKEFGHEFQETNTHLFNILSILETSETGQSFMNKMLYAILPVTIESIGAIAHEKHRIVCEVQQKLQNELILWHIVAKRFHRNDNNKNHSPQWPFSDANTRKTTASYLKLLLTFTSPRFAVIVQDARKNTYNYAFEQAKDDVSKYFTADMDHLHEEQLKCSEEVWPIFVAKAEFKTQNYKSYQDYVLLSIVESSMLFRMKEIIMKLGKKNRSAAYQKCMQMIANKKTIIEAGDSMSSEEPPNDLPVNQKDGKRKADNRKAKQKLNEAFPLEDYSHPSEEKLKQFCAPSFIDSLIVFYQYREIRERYKSIFGTKRSPKEYKE